MLKLYVKCITALNSLKENKKGQGLVEYGLIIGLVAVVVIASLALLGGKLKEFFNTILTALGVAPPA